MLMYFQPNWDNIDKKTVNAKVNNIEFIKPAEDKPIDIECKNCNTLVSSIEDCNSIKDNGICEECSNNKAFT